MPKQYRTREDALTAVDTRTALNSLGSQGSPGTLLVPQGATHIVGVIASGVIDHSAANDGGFLFRFEGSGLPNGPEVIGGFATGGNVATGQQENTPADFFPLLIPVTAGNEITLTAEMTGEDMGAGNAAVTVVFDNLGSRRAS